MDENPNFIKMKKQKNITGIMRRLLGILLIILGVSIFAHGQKSVAVVYVEGDAVRMEIVLDYILNLVPEEDIEQVYIIENEDKEETEETDNSLKDWMFNADEWKEGITVLNTDEQAEIEVENWMLDNSSFDLTIPEEGTVSELEQEVEDWMLSTDTWTLSN